MGLLTFAALFGACTPATTVRPGSAPIAEPARAAPAQDVARCLHPTDCASGVCEGLGCTDSEPGTCAPVQRTCRLDQAWYCDCDGDTHGGSSDCPGVRYAHAGRCGR
jgi:hypothetical protein